MDNGSGIDPMDPYTYTSSLVGGLETRTALKLSAVTVVFGHERALRFSATVTARFGGHPAGRVTISDGKKNVCVIKLVNGKGSCFPPKNTTIPVGTYTVDGVYAGNLLSSTSNRVALVVKK